MIDAIILDIGGVICFPDGPPLGDKWAPRCAMTPQDFDNVVYRSEWGAKALVGEITDKEMWSAMGTRLNLSSSEIAELEKDYWNVRWDTTLLDRIRNLENDVKLGILSNAIVSAREKVRPWINDGLFDAIVFSAEEHICKPDPRLYLIALQRLNVAAEATIFVDDRLENVTAANNLGIHGLHYPDFSSLVEALGRFCIHLGM